MGPEPALCFKVSLVNSRTSFLFSLILFPKSNSISQMTKNKQTNKKAFYAFSLQEHSIYSFYPSQWKIAMLCNQTVVPFVTRSLLRVIKINVSSIPPHVFQNIRSDFSHLDSGENSIDMAGSYQNYTVEKCFDDLQFPSLWMIKT